LSGFERLPRKARVPFSLGEKVAARKRGRMRATFSRRKKGFTWAGR
jgi:hypothetical protein